MNIKYLLLFLFTAFLTGTMAQKGKSSSKVKKQSVSEKKQETGEKLNRLPDSLYQKLNQCNGVDVVLFTKGKSMEFAGNNAKAPVSFIAAENANTVQGFKHIGLYTYKINGTVFLDCDIMLNAEGTEAIMRFKYGSNQVFFRKMNKNGLNILLQWIK